MTEQEWLAGIQKVHHESGGLIEIDFIDAATGSALLIAATMGDGKAAGLMEVVAQTTERINQAPMHAPTTCIGCLRAVKLITEATIFGVATPATSSRTEAIGFVFCDECGEDRASLLFKATECLRHLWPALRLITITHQDGGRA